MHKLNGSDPVKSLDLTIQNLATGKELSFIDLPNTTSTSFDECVKLLEAKMSGIPIAREGGAICATV